MVQEGEFSFAEMVAADERRKNEIKINTSFEPNQFDKDMKSASFESPPQKKLLSDKEKERNLLFGHSGLGDEDRTYAMINTDHVISLMPPQCWAICNKVVDTINSTTQSVESGQVVPLNAVVTSFLPCGVSIAISSTTDFITLRTFGVVSLRVLFSRDMDKSASGKGSTGANTKPQVQIKDIQVPPPDRSSSSSFASPSDSYMNNSPSHNIKNFAQPSTTSIKTPWPCMKIEAMILQRNVDFPCLLSVQTYSTSSIRSSAASTPQMKTRGKDKESESRK